MKVFLSSTAEDLVAYRKVADDTILRLSQESVVMERFGPLPGEPVAECVFVFLGSERAEERRVSDLSTAMREVRAALAASGAAATTP